MEATKETKTMATKPDFKPAGLVPHTVALVLDVADRGQSTTIAVLQEARAELRAAVDNTIELVEKLATSGLRFARKVTAKIDEASHETLGNVERLLGGAVKSARETSRAATDLAHTAVSGVAGQPTASA
jgi:hypothetical protein